MNGHSGWFSSFFFFFRYDKYRPTDLRPSPRRDGFSDVVSSICLAEELGWGWWLNMVEVGGWGRAWRGERWVRYSMRHDVTYGVFL